MRLSRTSVRVAAAVAASVLTGVVATGCDLVDEAADGTPHAVQVQRRYDGRTLLLLQPARLSGSTGATERCRPAATVACSLTLDTTYELLGGPSRVSLLKAKVVHGDDGSWGVQARFARQSTPTLTSSRRRAVADDTALLLVGNGNRALLGVPIDVHTGRLVITTGESERSALAVIAALSGG